MTLPLVSLDLANRGRLPTLKIELVLIGTWTPQNYSRPRILPLSFGLHAILNFRFMEQRLTTLSLAISNLRKYWVGNVVHYKLRKNRGTSIRDRIPTNHAVNRSGEVERF